MTQLDHIPAPAIPSRTAILEYVTPRALRRNRWHLVGCLSLLTFALSMYLPALARLVGPNPLPGYVAAWASIVFLIQSAMAREVGLIQVCVAGSLANVFFIAGYFRFLVRTLQKRRVRGRVWTAMSGLAIAAQLACPALLPDESYQRCLVGHWIWLLASIQLGVATFLADRSA